MRRPGVLLISFGLLPLVASADGLTVSVRQASGPFLVTVFTTPDPMRVGPVDVAVLVQDRKTGGVILDANVMFAARSLSGSGRHVLTLGTGYHAINKLLRSARLGIPDPGWWALDIRISRGESEAAVSTKIQVSPAKSRVSVVWPFLLIPPIAVALFVIHQMLWNSNRQSRFGQPQDARLVRHQAMTFKPGATSPGSHHRR